MLWKIDPRGGQGLAEQIAGVVRRGVTEGELCAHEQLPPAAELARTLGVNRNTVLAAYHVLRQEGLVEFRRGRGVRVTATAIDDAPVMAAARTFIDVASRHWLLDK